jgi:hypothetical protein
VFLLSFRVRSLSYWSATFSRLVHREGKLLGAHAKASDAGGFNLFVRGVP